MKPFCGIFPATVTPYNSRGKVDFQVLEDILESHIKSGVHGFFAGGGTVEGVLLTTNERKEIAEVVIAKSKGKVCSIIHVGGVNPLEVFDLAKHAERMGAGAIAAIPPIYYKVGENELFNFYKELAAQVNIPVLTYNIPGNTGVLIKADTVRRLLEIDNVVGLKYTDYDLFDMMRIMEIRDGVTLLSGSDEVLAPALGMGATGGVGLTYNFMPKLYLDIYNSTSAGDYTSAFELQKKANRIISAILRFHTIRACKEIMKWLGFNCGDPRMPIGGLSCDAKKELARALREAGFEHMVRNGETGFDIPDFTLPA